MDAALESMVEAVKQSGMTDMALAAIIAEAAQSLRRQPEFKWEIYEAAKRSFKRFDPTADEYERAIKMLAEALNI